MIWFWLLVAVVVGAAAYVRLSPTDVAAAHCAIEQSQDADGQGYCVRVAPGDTGALARIHVAAMGLARTTRLAGSVEEGRITYVTRSKWVGFPDFTTVEQSGGQIRMFARLRFGRSDFGVNRARLKVLMRAAGTPALD